MSCHSGMRCYLPLLPLPDVPSYIRRILTPDRRSSASEFRIRFFECGGVWKDGRSTPPVPFTSEVELAGELDDPLTVGSRGGQSAKTIAVRRTCSIDQLSRGGIELSRGVEHAPLSVVKGIVHLQAKLNVPLRVLAVLELFE